MPGRKHGVYGDIKMGIGSPVVSAADLNAWTLNLTRDRQVVTAFNDANVKRVAGLADYSGTLGGWWNSDSSPAFFDFVMGEAPVTLRLIPNAAEATFYFEGLANVDGALNVSATGAVAITGTWDAADNWTMAP